MVATLIDTQTTPQALLKLVEDWEDPYPAPVIKEHEGFQVVRDDLLGFGSKVRFVDFIVSNSPKIKHWIYGGSPRYGYGQISLAHACKVHGKKCSIFLADSKEKHEYTLRAEDEGARIYQVPNGMLNVTLARAREYAARSKKRDVFPFGFCHPTVTASIIKVARNIPIKPKEVWTVSGSGTLNIALQYAWPKAKFFTVQVGHKLKKEEIGRARVFVSPYKFPQNVKEQHTPPYPAAKNYDAKLWQFVKEHGSPGALIWNVGA